MELQNIYIHIQLYWKSKITESDVTRKFYKRSGKILGIKVTGFESNYRLLLWDVFLLFHPFIRKEATNWKSQ